ncbi:MAG: hypothetical protein P9L99_03550 [Candidatus Lernaella stagnicola]|nr:hypothetical protein [Candidatus Lernaella stagnicola]
MFQKYYCLAVVQILLLVFVMPQVLGFIGGLIAGRKLRDKTWYLAIGLVALMDVAVMIDKGGVPFLVGHAINMFLYTPMKLHWQLIVGLLGDAALVWSFHGSIRSGMNRAMRLVSPAEKSKQ